MFKHVLAVEINVPSSFLSCSKYRLASRSWKRKEDIELNRTDIFLCRMWIAKCTISWRQLEPNTELGFGNQEAALFIRCVRLRSPLLLSSWSWFCSSYFYFGEISFPHLCCKLIFNAKRSFVSDSRVLLYGKSLWNYNRINDSETCKNCGHLREMVFSDMHVLSCQSSGIFNVVDFFVYLGELQKRW